MSKKDHSPGPVPEGNRPKIGEAYEEPDQDESGKTACPKSRTGLAQEEDPERRMGDFTGRADHSMQEPGPANDGGKKHGEDAG
jgi:hypothetical protein